MKIDFTSNYPVFRKTAGQNADSAVKATTTADRKDKTDVVDFARGQSAAPDKTLTALKASIMRDIAAPASSDRIAELQNKLKAGTLHTSTDELVDAILGNE